MALSPRFLTRRQLLRAGTLAPLAGAAVFAPAAVQAQAFPSRPIRLVIPFAAGGLTDKYARYMAEEMAKVLGGTMVVENRPGAAGALAAQAVARSAPDGTALLFSAAAPLAVLPYIRPSGYEFTDFTPVGLAMAINTSLAARSDFPANNLQEFVALAKQNPGKYTYGHSGMGGMAHLSMALLESDAGIRLVPVPYAGDSISMPDFLEGRTDLSTSSYSTLLPHIKAGTVKMLTQFGQSRAPGMENVATAQESGYPRSSNGSWFAIEAPAGTPEAIVQRLNAAMVAACRTPRIREQAQTDGVNVIGSSVQQYVDFVAKERQTWGPLVKKLNIQ